MAILISGYYGFDNLGDEAILATLCGDLRSLGVKDEDIVVLSNDPEKTSRTYQVRALPRYDLSQIWRMLGRTQLFISGGGSLLQDVTSKRSIPYYLGLVELAFLRRVPVVMYGQGLGPVRSGLFRSWIGRAFKKSAACSVRDEGSMRFLRSLGIEEDKIALCADPVFQKNLVPRTSQTGRILLNLRPYSGWEGHQDLWRDLVSSWQVQGLEVEFIPLGPGDWEMGKTLQEKCTNLKVHTLLTLETMVPIFSGSKLCVSMRLHGLIFSALHDCLPVGLNYDPKVEAICKQLRVPFWELHALADLAEGLQEVLGHAHQHRLEYRKALEGLQVGALQNRDMLARVLR